MHIAPDSFNTVEVIIPRNHQAIRRQATIFFITFILQNSVCVYARADDPHLGLIEYEISCLPCHGIDGRGNGPLAKSLQVPPADLTKLTATNKGKFPTEKVANVIDGRAIVAAHGQREMPIWGDRYRFRADPDDTDAEIEQRARSQIVALIRYLQTIQKR